MVVLCSHRHGVHKDPWASGEGSRASLCPALAWGTARRWRSPWSWKYCSGHFAKAVGHSVGEESVHPTLGLPHPGSLSPCPSVKVLCKLWACSCSRSSSTYTTPVRSLVLMSLAKAMGESRLLGVTGMGPPHTSKLRVSETRWLIVLHLDSSFPPLIPMKCPWCGAGRCPSWGQCRALGHLLSPISVGGGLPWLLRVWQWDGACRPWVLSGTIHPSQPRFTWPVLSGIILSQKSWRGDETT